MCSAPSIANLLKAKPITRFLTAPSKVAQSLEWSKSNGSILNMYVAREQIDLAVAKHPDYDLDDVQVISPIPIHTISKGNRKYLRESVSVELTDIMNEYNVCGLIVAWPVSVEGRCGARCGRTLFCLDQLTPTISKPLCLYDINHHIPDEDDWGRAPAYGVAPSDKIFHLATKEQYKFNERIDCIELWNNFIKDYFPEYAFSSNNKYTTHHASLATAGKQQKNNNFFQNKPSSRKPSSSTTGGSRRLLNNNQKQQPNGVHKLRKAEAMIL